MHTSHLRVYLDENVPHSLYVSLMQRGVAVTTAQAAQTRSLPDDDQIRFAAAHGLVLLTTNVRHFHRWHRTFRARGENHGGIITVPQDDQLPERLHVRSAMLIDWAATFATAQNTLFRWIDLQTRMFGGYAPGDYRADEIALALGRTSGNPSPGS